MSLRSTVDFISKLINNKKSRDAYVYEHIRNGIPFQMRAMRDQREWTQADLAKEMKTSRTTITRLENPNNDKLTLKTLLEVASAFDVALLVKFVPFSRLVKEYEDVSQSALGAASIGQETRRLKAWAAAKDRGEAARSTAELIAARPLRLAEPPPRQAGLFGGSTQAAAWMPVRPLGEARSLRAGNTAPPVTLKAYPKIISR